MHRITRNAPIFLPTTVSPLRHHFPVTSTSKTSLPTRHRNHHFRRRIHHFRHLSPAMSNPPTPEEHVVTPLAVEDNDSQDAREAARETDFPAPEDHGVGGDYDSGGAREAARDSELPAVENRGIVSPVLNEDEAREVRESDYQESEDRSVVAEENEVEDREAVLEKISPSLVKLSCLSMAEGGNCDVYLVGTAHVSTESCEEVRAVVRFLKPQVVFLELCSSRVAILTPQSLKVPTLKEMIESWKKNHNPFGILYSWFLAKVASQLEVFPGTEFRVAYEEAMKYGGKVILGDRPVQVTLRRTWVKLPLWHKTKLIYSLLFQAIFLPSPENLKKMLNDMDDADMLTLVIQEMSKQYPTLMETLVHERDQYMSACLLRVAREHSSVVAVVGKGHLNGIKMHWDQHVEVRDLMEIPLQQPVISIGKILTTFGVAVAGVAIVSGIYLSIKK